MRGRNRNETSRRTGLRIVPWIAAALLAASPAHASWFRAGDAQQRKVERAILTVYPALVRIRVVSENPGGGRMNRGQSSGSGVIIHPDGYIITNHHVAGKAKHLVCRLPDGEEIEARLIGTDPLADIAIIQLDLSTRRASKPLPVARFGDSDRLQVGETVLAMGSPGAISQSVTKGIVANRAMTLPSFDWTSNFRLDGESTGSLVRWIAHDAVIFGGNSGGPLVNLRGEIVGINEIGFANLSGAIPGNLARAVAEQLIESGTVSRSWTGIEAQPRLRSHPLTRGILIGGVTQDSPAEEAGLQAGDILLAYDGDPVDCAIPDELPLFNARILSTPVGKAVPLRLWRDGVERDATLVTRPREPVRGTEIALKDWGLTVREITRMAAMEMQRTNSVGVLVTSVRLGGPAGRAKPALEPGDVLTEVQGQPIPDLAALESATETALKDRTQTPVLVAFERNQIHLLTVAKIGKDPEPEDPRPSRKPWLPLEYQPLTEDLAAALGRAGQKGLRVTAVVPNRTAEKAGVRVGDLLVKLDGEIIDASRPEDVPRFEAQIRQYPLDAEIALTVLRGDQTLTLPVTLDRPNPPVSDLRRHKDEEFEFTLRELVLTDRVERQLDEKTLGVLVERVERGGWADLAGVSSDDLILRIDGQPTASLEEAERRLRAAATAQRTAIPLFIRRGVHTLFLELQPNWNGIATDPEPKP